MRWKIRGGRDGRLRVAGRLDGRGVRLRSCVGRLRALGRRLLPNVTLTTQDGVDVRFYDDLIKGKIVAVNLIYTTCKYACPLETARLAQVARLLGDRMGRDIFFYSISIDPERRHAGGAEGVCSRNTRPGPAGRS